MNKNTGGMEVISVSKIEYSPNGEWVRISITETIPPYAGHLVTIFSPILVDIEVPLDESFPMVVIDFGWERVNAAEVGGGNESLSRLSATDVVYRFRFDGTINGVIIGCDFEITSVI